MTPIEVIKQAARAAESPELDEFLHLDFGVDIEILEYTQPSKSGPLDVPAGAIVGCGRDDFWDIGDTWRDAIEHLRGDDWGDDIFDYFEADLLGLEFPSPSSLRQLELVCIGGACRVVTGNHRLVAGKCWLISKYSNEAYFKNVYVSYNFLAAPLKKLFYGALKDKLLVRLTKHQAGGVIFWLCGSKKSEKWLWDKGELCFIEGKNNFFKAVSDILVSKLEIFFLDWQEIPHQVLRRLVDDEWAVRQLRSESSV